MADFNVRSDAVNVEQIMEQVRARIREKRGVDYTEAEVRELASVKLDRFLDPRGVRSDLLEQFKRSQVPPVSPELPNFAFEADTLFTSTRGPIRWIRKLLLPILKLFFNPNPLIQALNIQAQLNAAAPEREAKRDQARYTFDRLHYEVMHNLVVELTRVGIEVKNLKMQIESLTSRLEFSERRARALESVVAYKPAPEERPARNERNERSDRVDRPERNERADRNDRGDRGDRGDRSERSERSDRGERVEARRPDPPMSRPPVEAQPRPAAPPPEPIVAVDAAATAPADSQPAVAPAAEGPGQRSRRRRRRRGRRGSGAAATLMAGGDPGIESTPGNDGADGADESDNGDAETDAEPRSAPAIEAHPMHEHVLHADSVEAPAAHGSAAHTEPVEPPSAAPPPAAIESSPAPVAPEPSVQQPAAHDPSATPEQ